MALILPSTVITAAITGQVLSSVFDAAPNNKIPDNVVVQGVFVYGSGGTTAKFWIQTSLDNVNFTDVMSFAFTTANKVQFEFLGADANAGAVASQQDGVLADNTVVAGLVGRYWRVKGTTTGTYAGNTNVAFNMYTRYD